MNRLDPFFEPRGIIVAGTSAHPGKFGFVTLHNILRCGYAGPVHPVSLEGGEVLGLPVATAVDDLPAGAADLVFVCTPPGANVELLRACHRQGVRAAFVATAGYGEMGADGARAQAELVAVADELGILLAGPNGQGIVSTPASLCAQIVAPYPPSGRIGIVSQSGNFVSSFLNLSIQSEVGVSRAVSAGNAASITVADYLEYLADDPVTTVTLAYVESVGDGRAFYDQARRTTTRQPLVALQGGTTAGGRRAAASHTGSLASDARVFAGMCRQAGISQAATVEEAFEAAAIVRDPAATRRTRRGGGHHRGRVGRRHRRRDRPVRPHPRAAARRSPRCDRRHPPAALEPQQPDRPGRRRDARHRARRCSSWSPGIRRSTRSSSSASGSSRTRPA